MPIFEGAFAAGADYLDMAMSLSQPHPDAPYARTGVKLGDEQFAKAAAWEAAGRLALVGMGVEPGLSDVFARYAQDHLFSEIDEIGVRDGANLVVDGYDFAPSFSIWTTIEECLNPPVIWEAGRGWYTTAAVQRARGLRLPGGHRAGRVRERRARGGAPDPALGQGPARHLQVRPRRRVHRRPQDAAQAGPRQDGEGPRRRGRGLAARRRRGLPARPGHARRPDARQDLRRHLGDRHRQGRQAARGLPLPRGRQRVVDARVRLAGRRLADGDQPGRGARAAGGGRLDRDRRARPGGLRRRAVPRPADRVRLALGDARGRLQLVMEVVRTAP